MAKRNYTLENVQKFGDYLAKLPPKPRKQKTENLGAADLVRTIRKEIRSAMSHGYTIEDIVQAAKSKGFDLSAPTLKKYLRGAITKAKAPRKSTNATPPANTKQQVKRQPSEKPGAGVPPVTLPEGEL